MKKALSILLVVVMLAVISVPVGASNNNLHTGSIDYKSFIQKHDILYNELMSYLVIEKDGKLSFQDVNIRQIATKAELRADIVETYVDEMRFVLKQANEQGLTLNEKHVFTIANDDEPILRGVYCDDCTRYWCGRSRVVLDFPKETESYFCNHKTNQMLHNMTLQNYIFTGISVAGLFSIHVSWIIWLYTIASAWMQTQVSSAFATSGNYGVVFWTREGPHYDQEEWRSWMPGQP